MRFLRESLLAAAVLVAYAVAQSMLSARELQSLPPTTQLPRTPLLGLLGLVGFAVSLGSYGLLGRTVARRGGAGRDAAIAGAVAGFVAGVIGVALQALFFLDYVRTVVGSYGMPPGFVAVAVAATLIVAPPLGAVFGALVAWIASVVTGPKA